MVRPVNFQRPPYTFVATVLGAGTMGSQIAAHFANVGMKVFLLDIVPKDTPADAPPSERSRIAAGAIKAMLKNKRNPFMDPDFAARVTPGNFDDDLERCVAASDIVLEAVIERLDVKRTLFSRVAKAARGDALLATNTSGLPITSIAEGLPEEARGRLVGMHFFNPPRYLHLLEVVPSKYTRPEIVDAARHIGDKMLGKGVVVCRDTPNFIGNRIGIAEMILTNKVTLEEGYTVEEVDFLNGPLVGRPKTGSFRLGDLVGIDVAALVIQNLAKATSGDPNDPNYDELHDLMVVPDVIAKMIERGWIGDKAGQGFYKKTRDESGARKILALDLEKIEYRDKRKPDFPELARIAKHPSLDKRIHEAFRADGRGGDFLRKVYLPLFAYAARRVGEICDTPAQIDQAMRWGYGWKKGPFEMWDAAGVAYCVEEMRKLGIDPPKAALDLVERGGKEARWYGGTPGSLTVFVPESGSYREVPATEGSIDLDAFRNDRHRIHATKTAELLDIGDGIACLEFRSKMNILDAGVVELLATVFDHLEKAGGFRGLVIGNQGDHFSAGADAFQILMFAQQGKFKELEQVVETFQNTMMGLRHGPIPVVAAPFGMTLGGGCECSLHCAAIAASAELYMGLVEAGIGVVPAGGGLKELARRASAWAAQVPDGDPYPFLRRAWEAAATAKVSISGFDARKLGFLTPTDTIEFHRDRVIARAKARAIALAEAGWTPPDPEEPITVVGAPHGASFLLGAWLFQQAGYASEHDKLIAEKIANVLCGGMVPARTQVTAKRLLELEREAFVSLCGTEKTRARIAHTLQTGKPLRN